MIYIYIYICTIGFAQIHSANVVCILDESPVPTEAVILQPKADFKISRTYCLSSAPSRLRPEPRVWNHVFSTQPTTEKVEYNAPV